MMVAAAPGAASARPPASDGAAVRGRDAPPSAWQQLQQLLRELPHLLGDRVDLLALELERAGRALARIVVLIVAAAVLAVTAWLAAWVVVFMALLTVGLPPIAALAIVLLINAITAWLALARAQTLVGLLSLPATRRHLTVARGREPPPDSTNGAPHDHDTLRPARASSR